MFGKEVKNSRIVSLAEVAELLSEREKDGELGFEQKSTLDYATKLNHLSYEKSQELISKLSKLPHISETMAVKVVDLLPKNENELKLIFQQEKRDLTSAQAKEILEIISSL